MIYSTNLSVRFEEDEGNHHEIVRSPADDENGDDDDGDAKRFHFGALKYITPGILTMTGRDGRVTGTARTPNETVDAHRRSPPIILLLG